MASIRTPAEPDESVKLWDFGKTTGAVVNRVRMLGVHVEITRNGKPAAMVVPAEWWQHARALSYANHAHSGDYHANLIRQACALAACQDSADIAEWIAANHGQVSADLANGAEHAAAFGYAAAIIRELAGADQPAEPEPAR